MGAFSFKRRARRAQRKSALSRMIDAFAAGRNAKAKAAEARPPMADEELRQAWLNKMTNWQRNQFLRTVRRQYHGQINKVPGDLFVQYAEKPHWKSAKPQLMEQEDGIRQEVQV